MTTQRLRTTPCVARFVRLAGAGDMIETNVLFDSAWYMMTRSATSAAVAVPEGAVEQPGLDGQSFLAEHLLNRAVIGLTAGLFILRLITPTEAAEKGETLWIAQLSLMGLLAWVLARYASGRLALRFGWLDLGVSLLAGGYILGSLIVISTVGDQRAAWNHLWEWVGVAATFFLVRQVLSNGALPPGEARSWLLLPVVLVGVGTAGLGIWQHYYGTAHVAATYKRLTTELDELNRAKRPSDPAWQKAIRHVQTEFLMNEIPLDPVERSNWEQRALHSTEPFGFFALANSFAGWLAVVLILLLGNVWRALLQAGWRDALLPGLMCLPTAYCLLLTKSRTGWVGLAVGLAVLGVAVVWERRRLSTRPLTVSSRYNLLAMGAVGLLLVGVVSVTGGLDKFVVVEAGKSLRYRFEWWTATWEMLTTSWRNLLFGVGPGNFRQHYLEFKLPQSSEEIADPHNLLLDAWANGGLIGLTGLLLVVGWTISRAWGHLSRQVPTGEFQQPDGAQRTTVGQPAFGWIRDPYVWLIGLSCAWVVLLQGDFERIGSVAALAMGSAAVLNVSGRPLAWSVPMLAAAFVALGTHLLGAGGIATPAISLLVLLLAALCDDEGQSGEAKQITSAWDPTWKFALALGIAGMLFAGGWWNLTAVLSAGNNVAAGDLDLSKGQLGLADQAYRRAERADPWWIEPIRRRVVPAFERYWQSGKDDEHLFNAAVALQKTAIARDPYSFSAYSVMGDLYSRRFDRTRKPVHAQTAADWYASALERYPTRALLHAQCAEAWSHTPDRVMAQKSARRALELHDVNVQAGHPDKELPTDRLLRMRKIMEGRAEPPAETQSENQTETSKKPDVKPQSKPASASDAR